MNNAVEYHDKTVAQNWNDQYKQPTFKLRIDLINGMLSEASLAGHYWLDAGCGTGVMSRLLAGKGARVMGVDASSKMLEIARSSETNAEQIEYSHVETVEQLSFDTDHFDGIVCSSVLEYIPQPQLCLAEFHRVLKPGGSLVISVPNSRSLVRQLHGVRYYAARAIGQSQSEFYGHSLNAYTRKTLESLLVDSGFESQQIVQLGAYLPLIGLNKSDFVSPLIFAHAKTSV